MPRTTKKTTAPIEKHTIPTIPAAEQPYRVPENWRWVYLPAVCEYMRSGGDKPQDISVSQMNNHSIPVVANGMQDDGIIGYTNVKNEKAGTLTVSARGTIGHAIVRNYPYYPVIRLIVLSPNSFTISSYLKYIFDYFEEEGTGTSIPQLTVPSLKNKIIPLPPLAEQQRIVDRIERLFAKLDEAREKAQAVVDGFENRKAAILHKAFTGELTRKWREERGIGIKTWQTTTLSTVVNGFKYGTSEKSDYSYLGMPVLRIPNIGNDGIIFSDMKYLSTEDIDDSDQIHENDILIIRSNGSRELVGKCILVPPLEREYTYASFLIRITPNKSIQPSFLEKYLNSYDARSQMFSKAKSSAGINNINTKELGGIIIHLPTLQEQTEIVSTIQKLIQQERRAHDLAESVITQIDVMKKAILARAFRGELGTNDPSEAACEG